MAATRVAFVSHSPWMGGAERCLLELARSLAATRDVHVLLPAPGALGQALADAGATTHLAPARWWARDPGMPRRAPDARGAAATLRALGRIRPDVVVSNTLVHPPGALAAAGLRLPHVWWIQEFGDRDHGFRFDLGHRNTLRLVARLSCAVVVASRAVRDHVREAIPASKLRLVPYGVDVPVAPRAASGPPADPPRLAILGRVRPSKGQQDAVLALAALHARGIRAELHVGGDGELAALASLARRAGVERAVHLHGQCEDPLTLLDRADVALTCSRDEAFGRVTVEAMKRGRPVVGAASGGTAELIEDGRTGRTYPPGDPAALAGAVEALLGDDEHRARIAEAGRRFAARTFTADRHAAAFARILDEVAR
jgi:glycosyltransferase involved in cell wall biosynthesis